MMANCNEKTATMETKPRGSYAHRSKVVQSVLELLEGVRRMLEGVRRMLQRVRRILEPAKICALYAVGTAGDSLCPEELEVVLYMLEVVSGVRMCPMGA